MLWAENFCECKLKFINALNFYITMCMAFLTHVSMKPDTNALECLITQKVDIIKRFISAITDWLMVF